MRWQTLLLPAAAGAFLVTASCSKNQGTEDVTPENQPSAAAPAADSANAAAAAAGAAVDSTAMTYRPRVTSSSDRTHTCNGTG